MTVQHKDIPNDGLHEPKGASTASLGQAYLSDGAGSGIWSDITEPAFDPKTMVIERILDGVSLATSQEPTGLDAPLQIEFGVGVNSVTDPVMLSTAGALTINTTGTYRIKLSLAYGRTGGAGVSEMYFRALVNGVQAGQSVHARIGSADVYIPYSDEAWLTLPAGVVITYELLRDSVGNDSGGIYSGNPTLAGWNGNPCAAIRVERWTA
mgnify:CR=1 FL=1|tara:strand:- start:2586 stop:3212 length:627 start_codon:yes stop_codon:yes gene_type:complete